MYRKRLPASLLLMAVFLALSLLPAFASVGLTYFKAEPTTSNTIMLKWETATEDNTRAFKLYRSTSESPADWGPEIGSQTANGNAQTGDIYNFEDKTGLTAGVRYWYLLKEVTNDNTTNNLATASAVVGATADTPTTTATTTATSTPTRTPTVQPTSTTGYTVPTFTVPAPTATRKYTDAPPTAAPGTPTPRLPATATPFREPTATPLPPAQVASPTGPVPQVTIPVAPAPSFTPEAATPGTPVETATPTPELAAVAEGPQETATPLPTRDVTPIIFAAEARGKNTPTPQSTEQVAGQNSSSLAMIVGGSAIGLAGLLAAVLLFLRSRRA